MCHIVTIIITFANKPLILNAMEAQDQKIITIGRFSYSRSLLLQALLNDSNIESFLVPKDVFFPPKYTDIRVKESDVAEAMKVIANSQQDYGKSKAKALKELLVMRRILVPVDFSETSLEAAKFACSIANRFKSEVMLVHVTYNFVIDTVPRSDFYDYQKRLAESLIEIKDVANDNLEKLQKKLQNYCKENNYNKVEINSVMLAGNASAEIIDYADTYKPFLIIMGIRGLSAKNKYTYGKVADEVVNKSNRPVLVLPSDQAGTIDDIKEVMYAMDYDDHDISSINKIIQMVSPLNIKIHCVHFSFVRTKPWDKMKLEEIENHLRTEYKDVDITFQNIVTGDVSIGIETFIRNNNIGAIAVTTYKRKFLENLFSPNFSEKLFKTTGKPILFFPVRR